MKTTSVELSKTEPVLVRGFNGEDIEVTVEQLENRIMPDQSSAGFLD
jgi:hypothetical protein